MELTNRKIKTLLHFRRKLAKPGKEKFLLFREIDLSSPQSKKCLIFFLKRFYI